MHSMLMELRKPITVAPTGVDIPEGLLIHRQSRLPCRNNNKVAYKAYNNSAMSRYLRYVHDQSKRSYLSI